MTKTKDWFKKVLSVNKTVSSGNKVKQEPALTPISDIENILNKAIIGDYSELDDIVRSSQKNDKNRFVILNSENFKNFCSQWLKLEIESRSDHQYIYSNILSHYNRNEQFEYKYYRSELLLLAIAANDQLAERYHKGLFAEKNLSLLPLLVGGKWYVSEFIERFPELYQEQKLKEKTILSNEQTIGFFSVIAANKYQELLKAVLTPDALDDLKLELQKAQEDPLYGVLEMAVLMENQVFIEKVLESIEQDISNKSSKDNESGEDELLLKRSFITLLATAVSQEHNSIVTYLCEKCTKNEDSVIQEAYKETLSDDKIIKQINKQILRNINGAGKGRRSKEQKMYDTILQTALCVNNMEFVAKILDSIESKPQISTIDEDGRDFLRNSLNTILEHAEGRTLIEKRMSAKTDGDVKEIYTEVYNNRKALDPTQKTDTTVSMEQDATELNFQGKHTMTKERKNPTAQEELPLSDDKDDSGIDSGSATASIQSLSRASGSTGSDTSLRGGVLTDDESQDEESKDQKPVKQVHFQNDSQTVLVKEITPHSTSNEELGAPQLNQDETPGLSIADCLHAKLQAQNEKGEYYEDAKSGETTCLDLLRSNNITINNIPIPIRKIQEWYDNKKNKNYREIATSIFTEAFQYAAQEARETKIPTSIPTSIRQELVINYNQSGYFAFIFTQVMSILKKFNLMLFENVHKSSINCTDSNCVSIKFDYLGYIAPSNDGGKKLCELNSILEFNLESDGELVSYEDVKISLDASKELEVRYVEVPRDKPEADAPEAPKVVSLIPEIRKYLSSGVLPELFTSNEPVDVLHNGEVIFSYDKESNQRSKRSTIKNENADQGIVGQSKSKKTYRNVLFTTAIATFTVALTATAAASVFTAVYHETMPIKLVEAVGTYSLGIALIAACCLAVTAIIYCCTKPSNSLDNNNVEGRSNLQTVTGS